VKRRLFLQVYLTMLGIVVLFGALAAVGWCASHAPARRAAAVDPMVALRE